MRVAAVSVQRPIFRGDKQAVWTRSVRGLGAVVAELGGVLETARDPVTGAHEALVKGAELAATGPDLVLVQATTFATADCFLPLLRTGRPTILWAVPEPTTGGPLPLNSLCGANFVLSVSGDGTPAWLYGDLGDDAVRARLRVLLRAARATARLKRARVLLIGGPAPTFTRFEVTPAAVAARFGSRLEQVPLDELLTRIRAVPDQPAWAAGQALQEAEDTSAVTAAQATAAGRVEVALAELAADYDAVAIRCWPEIAEQTGAMPCASVARLFDRGCPAACEGDVLGALSMVALQAMAECDPVLLDLSHVTDDGAVFWHCGNAPKSLAAGPTRLATHFNRPDTGCVRQMCLAPGPTTMLRFTDPDRAVFFEGEWRAAPMQFDGVSGVLADVRWAGRQLDGGALVAAVLDRRLPHHYAFVPGHWADECRALASWLGLGEIVFE